MIVEGCYQHAGEGAAVLNGDTGHAMLCQGVDTGVVDKTSGITVLTPPRDIPDVVVPESDAEIQRKLKNPKES